jgi:hypothetical protein
MWKEAVMVYVKVQSQHLPRETEENKQQNSSVRICQELNLGRLEHKAGKDMQ